MDERLALFNHKDAQAWLRRNADKSGPDRVMEVYQTIGIWIIGIGIVAIPIYARVMRASVLGLRDREFVSASRALGASEAAIFFRKVVPNALTPIIVQGTLGIAGAILDVAALSFLGLGAQPPTPEWGSMIGGDRNLLFSSPHVVVFPGIAITLTVLAFNLIGDGLRDALDPRLQR